MVRSFAEELMGVEADVVCGATYGEVSPDRVNRRNGYRTRRWDTRTGSIDLRIPKLRTGSYFPKNDSTKGSDVAPTSSAFSQPGYQSPVSSVRYSPNNTTNGPSHAVT